MKFGSHDRPSAAPPSPAPSTRRGLDMDERLRRYALARRAVDVVGGGAELARRLGAYPGQVGNWLHNHRPVPQHYLADLEAIIGEAANDETRDH